MKHVSIYLTSAAWKPDRSTRQLRRVPDFPASPLARLLAAVAGTKCEHAK